ncbi:hypothetical protein ACW66K_00090 [Aerococcus urinaeequi]|uniref:Lipoprotein n=1 Tax=Aerococcus viridans TaxID=1377 RepID=A0A2N6UCJ5_9LACT|nr:hypothetical protein [Aerococcus viridans]PMC79266.1 hypothetical protein CJ191_07640 [Aerococcus viridans]
MKKGIILGISMLLLAACSNGQGNEPAASGVESTETATSIETSSNDESAVESSEAAEMSAQIAEVSAQIESITEENAQLQAEIDSSEQSTIEGSIDATAKHIRDQAAAFIELTVPKDTELYGEDIPQLRIDLEPYVSNKLLDLLAPAEAGVLPPESENWVKVALLEYQVLVDPQDMAGESILVVVNAVTHKNDYGHEFTIQGNYSLEMVQENDRWVVDRYTYSADEYFGTYE